MVLRMPLVYHSWVPSTQIYVYAITGNREDELKREVGRQVEVTGYVEVDESKGTSKVKDLPRMNISQWGRVQDFCPERKK